MTSGDEEAATDKSGPIPTRDNAPLLGSQPSPPAYQDVYGRIIEARDNAKGGGDFMQQFCGIVCGTLGFIIVMGLMLFIPITMITVGSVNINNCPAEKYIPIWLIVSGSVAAIMQLIFLLDSIVDRCAKRDPAAELFHQKWFHRSHHWVLGLFWFAWFIAGNVWVFSIYRPNTLGEQFVGPYCDHVTYYLAFTIITLVYFIACMLLCCCSCICCCASINIRNRLARVR